jgi:DNA invertase Pin-like site-specific DNA recombinase
MQTTDALITRLPWLIAYPALPEIIVQLNVAAYARVSSALHSQENSFENQVAHYSEYIRAKAAWSFKGVYADYAESGLRGDRAEFQRLLRNCREGEIDLILTKSISRFARNTVTLLETVRELKSLNIDIYFEREKIHSISPDGEFMLTLLAAYAQEESRSISENKKWQYKKQFAAGKPHNVRLFGYVSKNNILSVVPAEAIQVARIFNEYIGGMSAGKLAKKLRDENVATVRGGKWTAHRIMDIIHNERYMGDCRAQKYYVDDVMTKILVKNKGILPQYYLSGTHPAIVGQATWDLAQVISKERNKNPGRSNSDLSGKIVCGHCGKNYVRTGAANYKTWICSSVTGAAGGKRADCPASPRVSEKRLEAAIEMFGGLKNIAKITAMQNENGNVVIFTLSDDTKLERLLSRLDEKSSSTQIVQNP